MKVSILIFTYRPQSECIMSAHANMAHLTACGHKVTFGTYGSALVHRSRNQALEFVSEKDQDAVIFLDDDMLLGKPDALATLVEDMENHKIVSGLCTTRGSPKAPDAVELAVKWWGPDSRRWIPMDYVPTGRLVTPRKDEYFGVGAACLAVRRDAAEELVGHYLSASDWRIDNRTMLDRLHVRGEYRDNEQARISAARRKLYAEDRYVRVFGFPVMEDEVELGEDVGFSMRCQQVKIPIAIDSRITPGHVGDYPYGVWNYVPKLEREKIA